MHAPTPPELDKPSFTAGSTAVWAGDCVELLRRMRPSSVDLVVTSPPYNIGKEYERPMSIVAYLDWCEVWIRELYRVVKPNGTFWLNLGYLELEGRAKAIPIPYLLWQRNPFYLIQEVVWQYGAGVSARTSYSPRNEKFLWYTKSPDTYTFNLDAVRDPDVKYPNQKKNGKLKCNPLGKNPGDVWYFPKVTSGENRSSKERTPHPAQFPIAVIDRIVKASSNTGDLVLDPFVGSGSTLEACLLNGRRGMGFEIKPEYVTVASQRLLGVQRRIEAEKGQLELALGV
ncbi:MAG: site-specific DNA-methyltransferase [Phycisphaerae bacterium]|nr:site-specific DNA-methyltransferase [Phycisphaerae bacterium]